MAMLLAEEEEDYARLLARSRPVLSCGSLIELVRVATLRRGARMRDAVDELLGRFAIEPVPVDRAQVELAVDGHARFGIGRGAPPAVLNFGDLFAYALARHLDAPLLFKGDDFGQTDVRPALTG
jgi:ribonuclease VapC